MNFEPITEPVVVNGTQGRVVDIFHAQELNVAPLSGFSTSVEILQNLVNIDGIVLMLR
jgi:hypothetical protein